jgi:ATP-dependent Clp protease ATP-binding subunit ClpC
MIMTSNLGAREINKDSSLGFQSEEGGMNFKDIRNFVMAEVKRAFNPEFINRIDEIVVFHNLDKAHLAQIFDLMVKEISDRLVDQKITISVKKKTREYLIDKGFDEKFGARPLRRLLQKEVEDPLSMEILKGRFTAGDTIDVELRGEKITFRKQESRKALKAPAQPAGLLTGEKEVEKVPT